MSLSITITCDTKGRVPVDTVFLDAGGVLVFPNWPLVSAMLGEHGIPVEDRALSAADHIAKREIDVADYLQSSTAEEQWVRYFNLVLTHAGVERNDMTEAVFRRVREYDAAHNLWEVVSEDVAPTLARLRSLGLRLVVVSNSNGTLATAFERLGLASQVDFLIDSHEEGVRKPDPRLFEIALTRAGAGAGTTIHIGDLYHVDVLGARAAGLRGVLLDSAGLYGDHECERVRTLAEFADCVETELSQQT